MPRIVLPLNPKLCPHRIKHAAWRATDGDYGVCMMAPSHITRCIRMLITSIRSLRNGDAALGDWDWPWPETEMVYIAEDHLETMLGERNRRIKEGRWRNVS